jgi:surface antigen
MSMPLPSFVSREDVTGSIAKPLSPLSPALDSEDWRRAKGALAIALDPQGNGAVVRWDNPVSGVKGSFLPTSEARAVEDQICRDFETELSGSHPSQILSGSGCRDKQGEWHITNVKPSRKT